ncbi:hypothetical protein UFOVP1346_48 [uncultured Caudovirales phage]|uniref:Uncharacterized protein n=1 Tax=uncultured Caudovirales phage TaxID=2100421 RepID=A0A6J5PX38_9CAUD|nr:hypothetical protein UFOVP921_28 [uncultured Caudovirales phage]CAB4187215.1 hypothetical protein UFOVP1156_4 [uncultured Caudovirales phage]CAB4200573.1 hypothetical protein UFOVP1346_48 [uncultured Caudovirales phage]
MSFTKVKFADGTEEILRIHHTSVDEAIDLEELIPNADRTRLIPMIEVTWWAPAHPPKNQDANTTAGD